MEIWKLTATQLGKKIKDREISAVEALNESFRRIDEVEEEIHSYVCVNRDRALAQAAEVQKKID